MALKRVWLSRCLWLLKWLKTEGWTDLFEMRLPPFKLTMPFILIQAVSRPGGIALSYLLNHADDEYEVSAGFSWAKGRRAAFICPRCKCAARMIYMHPYRCAYCFKVDEAVSKTIHIMATTPQSSGARAIQKRHSQMTRQEVDAEINATIKAL